MWRKEYPYLQDADFLKLIDTQHLQNRYIKITLLDWDENPIKEIQGMATGGSISINGNSSVRRTCTLNMMVEDIFDAEISNVRNLISIGRKIFLEIGISNNTGRYEEEYPILWYPQGYYVFTQCSLTSGVNSVINLSAQLKDKMCLLNGECGGILPSTIQFDRMDTIDSNGDWITVKTTLAQIIREAVNHWGKEQLGKILISDIDEKVKMTMRWIGDKPVYLINNQGQYSYSMDKNAEGGVQEFNYGDDIGFIYTDFTYPGELIAKPGDNICTAVLDKIKDVLGNYEYFYDVYGNFIFQEIKNYLNTTQATVEINNMKNEDYQIDISKGKSEYDFKDNELVTSFSNTPQYNRIKNDFVIWGVRTNTNDIKIPIRYHLAIDKKPAVGDIFDVYFYIDPEDGLKKAKVPAGYDGKDNFPNPGLTGVFYLDKNTGVIYKWKAETASYVSLSGYPSVECEDMSHFPVSPEIDTLYIDKSTDRTYMWKTQPGDHYDEIQAQIDALTSDYESAAAALNQTLANYQSQLKDIENQIIALNKEYESELTQLERYTQDYNNLSTSIEYNENKILTNNATISNLESTITYLSNVYTDLINQAMRETDPDKKAELLAQAQAIDEQKQSVIVQKTALEQENESLVETIDELSETQAFDQSMIQQIQAMLNSEGYYDSLETLENAKAGIQLLIDQTNQELNELTNDYNTDLAELLYEQKQYVEIKSESTIKVQTTDWRSQLYLQGAAAEALGLDSNYYYPELNAEWPKLYDLAANSYIDDQGRTIYTGAYLDGVLDYPWDLDYWLDFIDTETEVGGLSVNNIGRRSISESKDEYNCLFEPEIPDFILIETGQDDTEEKRQECEDRSQKYIQVSPEIYSQAAIGGIKNSCFERVKEALYDYTAYNNSISITTLPIYHLDINKRIKVASQQNDIYGDFLSESISLPLTVNGTMTISAIKCNQKL